MENFPNIAQTSKTTYVGYVSVNGHTVYLFVRFPYEWTPGYSLRETQVVMDSESANCLGDLKRIFAQKISVIRNAHDFFQELYAFLQRSLPISSAPSYPISTLPELYNDLKHVESMIQSVDPTFSKIQFHKLMALPNQLEIRVDCKIIEDYPYISPVFTCDMIPEENKSITVHWSTDGKFSEALKEISKSLSVYLAFWKELLHIDSSVSTKEVTFLNEPQRTIELGEYCYLKLYLLPLQPRSGQFASDWTFLGPPSKAHPYQLKFHQRLNKWNTARSVIENIESILETQLPKKNLDNLTAFTSSTDHCEICYDALDTNIQEIHCECGRMYHRECLLTLFRRSGKKTAFKVIFGECLYCNAPLTVRLY